MRWLCKGTNATACALVLLICLVGLVPYLRLAYRLRFETGLQPLTGTRDKTQWKEAVGLPELRKRKQVTWLHMHKFGGTFMTKMADLQGEAFPPGNINANWLPDFCSTPPGQRILCAQRTGFGNSQKSDISWSAMERELDHGDFCEGALMGTMLREPLSALQSVLTHDRFDKAAILETLRLCVEKAPAKHFMYQPPSKDKLPPCLPAWDTYQHFDNFATRTLAGAYAQAPCGITLSHLEAAKAQLQRMDVLTILEQLDEHMPQLQEVFHWNLTLVQTWKKVNRKPGRHSPQVRKSEGGFTPEDMVFLKRVNAIDLELYKFAFSLARNMTRQAQDLIAKRGEVTMPSGARSEAQEKMLALRQKVATRFLKRERTHGHRS